MIKLVQVLSCYQTLGAVYKKVQSITSVSILFVFLLQGWYAKTPLGKKRAKAAQADEDGDGGGKGGKGKKGKKGKKGGKKKGKKKK